MNYQSIRNRIMRNERLFRVIRFFFTPIRITREHFVRRTMSNEVIARNANLSKNQKKILYFGIPEHNNLGDIAQTYCTRMWIKENYPDRIVIEAKTRVTFDRKFDRYLNEILNDEDIILFQSGYCTRHNNPDHLMHLHIAKRFHRNILVVLPQTVKLDDKRDVLQTRKVFGNCERIRFITRDRLSYKKAESFVDKSKLECFPDIVTSLIGRVDIKSERNGVLLCVRNDDEKYYNVEELNRLKDKLCKIFERVDETDTNSHQDAATVFENLENEVHEKICQFAKYNCVITDRYHGTIFSLIANTPVIVIKTNDHKVTSAVEWFEGLYDKNAVQLAGSLEEAYEMARIINEGVSEIQNNSILFEQYYRTRLKDLVNSIGWEYTL